MAAPVWVLSVDLQAKTATFQSGMAEAAKSARGSFNDIRSGSGEMSVDVGRSMTESREGVILLGEAFGVHLPRGLSSFIAALGPVGAAMEAAFPFVAILVGAVELIDHLEKMHEAGEKLTNDQQHFGVAVQTAFNSLDDKLLQAGIRSDELHNNHLGALKKQLELIDHQSMAELAQQFGVVAKAADSVFADLKTSWYQFGTGSAGAKHALTEFQNQYDSLLAQGKNSEANDLLKGTRESAEKVLALQKQAAQSSGHAADTTDNGHEELTKHEAALTELKKSGVGYTEKELAAQETLVQALAAQETIAGKLAAIKTVDKSNAKTSTGNEEAEKAAAAAKEAADHRTKMADMALAAEKEQAAVSATIHQQTVAQRLAVDISLADKEYAIQQAGNAALIAALDKSGKDYNNQLKALQDKGEELTAQHANTLAALQGKATQEQYAKDLQALEQGEREKIEATAQGSAARLAAIGAALKAEEAQSLTQTSFYRDLENQKTQTVRQATEEQNKLQADAGKEAADNVLKTGEMALAAQKEQQALADSARRVTTQMRMAEDLKSENDEYALKLQASQNEIAALDKSGKDYQNKLKEFQDKEKQMTQQHENDIAAIRAKAAIESNSRILSAQSNFNNTMAAGLTQVLMGHKSFAAMMDQLGNQVVTGLIENSIKSILANDMTKESDAAKAARKAYLTGESIPVIGPVMGPVLAAAAYAGVMAFETGGVVPGVGRGDTVPAMLTPGEGVIPGGTMDQLNTLARSGGLSGNNGNHYHLAAHYAPNVQAFDAEGVGKVLTKHAQLFQKHMENTMRRMNK